MSGSVNKVILIGNVGQDPEIRSFQSGGRVCNLSIATSERWKDRESNEQKEKTQWHRVVVFNENLINLICETGKKLHTVRSRNDQVGTDIRLRLRKSIDNIYLLDIGGFNAGYSEHTLSKLVDVAKKHKVNKILIEQNFGQ